MPIAVLLADDQPLVRAGLRTILASQEDITVVGEAPDGEQAVAMAVRLRPDVVLMDVRMPVLDGIEATRRATRGGLPARILILTTYELDEYVFDALAAGASGFLLKSAPPEALIQGVRVLAAGDALLAPSVTRRLIEEFGRRPPPARPPEALATLTDRETEVLRLVARGLTNGEIAVRLHVGETTVKTHVGHVLDKLDLRDRVQAVILAYEAALVQPGT